MATPARVVPPPPPSPPAGPPGLRLASVSPLAFTGLVLSGPRRRSARRGVTAVLSFVVHAAVMAALVIVPLTFEDVLPDPDRTVRAFFVTPAEVVPPPPPPPPPAAGVSRVSRPPAAPRLDVAPSFVAPVEVPTEIVPEETIDLGVEGGVPGGVEGGVPGGVVGGIVGGLPEAAPPPAPVVRIGGAIKAPKLVDSRPPVYPEVARSARIQGVVIIEARVGTNGRVKSATVLRGIPLLDQAALDAVREWRYRPLLLNGQPTEFILTVTVNFRLSGGTAVSGT